MKLNNKEVEEKDVDDMFKYIRHLVLFAGNSANYQEQKETIKNAEKIIKKFVGEK
jgi:hypothetical protein